MALAPWLWAARHSGWKEALATGALLGVLYGALVGSWVPEALRSLGSSPTTALAGLVATAAWAKLPLFAAVGGIAWALRRRAPSLQIAGVALAFGLGEWALARWSLGVPWALVGESQLATLGVAQLAAAGGVPLLSALVVAQNQALALAVEGSAPALRSAVALAAAWLALALLGLPLAQALRPAASDDAGGTLLVVQPDLPRRERWEPRLQPLLLERVASYTDEVLAQLPERAEVRALVWPENLLTAPIDADPKLASALQARVDGWGIPLITGVVRSARSGAPQRYRSSVVWIEPGRGVRDALDKVRAIPLLESSRALPGEAQLIALYGRAASWPKVEEAASAGALRGAFTLSAALCYEVLFPRLVAERRPPESLALLNLADDSWVAGDTATRQLTDAARFRAIEQRLPLVRVAHGGLSAAFDAFGRPLFALPLDTPAHATLELAPSPPPTLLEKSALLALPLGIASLFAALPLFLLPSRPAHAAGRESTPESPR